MGAFIVAAVAAAAILLIFIGITAGRGSGVSSRLERYASARKGDATVKKTGDGPVRLGKPTTSTKSPAPKLAGSFGMNRNPFTPSIT